MTSMGCHGLIQIAYSRRFFEKKGTSLAKTHRQREVEAKLSLWKTQACYVQGPKGRWSTVALTARDSVGKRYKCLTGYLHDLTNSCSNECK